MRRRPVTDTQLEATANIKFVEAVERLRPVIEADTTPDEAERKLPDAVFDAMDENHWAFGSQHPITLARGTSRAARYPQKRKRWHSGSSTFMRWSARAGSVECVRLRARMLVFSSAYDEVVWPLDKCPPARHGTDPRLRSRLVRRHVLRGAAHARRCVALKVLDELVGD